MRKDVAIESELDEIIWTDVPLQAVFLPSPVLPDLPLSDVRIIEKVNELTHFLD